MDVSQRTTARYKSGMWGNETHTPLLIRNYSFTGIQNRGRHATLSGKRRVGRIVTETQNRLARKLINGGRVGMETINRAVMRRRLRRPA